jgi:hypothetical protein
MRRFVPLGLSLLVATAGLSVHLVTAGGSSPRSGRVSVSHGRGAPRGALVRGRTFTGLAARATELPAAASAPLVGSKGPVAVPSRNGERLAYNTWRWTRRIDWHQSLAAQGIMTGDELGTPMLRIRRLDTGGEFALEAGSFSAAWRWDGALAYVRGAEAAYRANTPYLRSVLVRGSVSAAPTVWSLSPQRYLVLGWAGRRLVVEAQREGGGTDLLVFDGPGRLRPLAAGADLLAIAPDGSAALVADDPALSAAPAVRLVDVTDGAERARVPLSAVVDPVTSASLTWVDGPGDWAGEHIVVSSSSGLVVLRVRGGLLSVEQVLHVDSATRPNGTLWEPRFGDESARTIITWTDVSNGHGPQSAQLVCDRFARTCTEGSPVPSTAAPRPVYDESGGE